MRVACCVERETAAIGFSRFTSDLTSTTNDSELMSCPIQLLSTDFDGTLFAEFEDPPIPRDLQDLLRSLHARGAKWIIHTGRDMSSLMEALGRAAISVEPDYLVTVEREIHVHHDSQY